MIAGWKRVLGLGAVASSFVIAAGAPACGGKKGGLMLAIHTDMKAPKDVNVISLSVLVNNQVKVNYQGRVTPDGKVLLPATVALTEPEDPNASIRIRVVAFQERRARVLRDVRTTIPRDGRVALLRVPLNFVNDGSGSGELPIGTLLSDDDVPIGSGPGANGGSSGAASSTSGGASSGGGSSGGGSSGGGSSGGGSSGGGSSGGGSSGGGSSDGGSSGGGSSGGGAFGAGEFNPYEVVTSSCPLDQTIIEGECRDDFVDSSTLPDFDERDVGKGDDPSVCMDVKRCFANARELTAPVAPGAITLDRTSCTLQLYGQEPNQLNLALVTPDTGECIRPNECYIPIDRGDGGWREENGQIKLPSFVCTLLTSKNLRLYQSTDCVAKKAENPICAETVRTPGSGFDGGGLDGSLPPSGPQRIIDEPFATSVRVVADRLYFVGPGRLGQSALIDPSATTLPTAIALPSGAPGQQPWALGAASDGSVGLTNAMSPIGYWLSNGSSVATPVNLGYTPVNSVTEAEGNLFWAAGAPSGGVFAGTSGSASRLPWTPMVDATLVVRAPTGFLLGDGQGNVSTCAVSTTTCSAPTLLSGSRIDGAAFDPTLPAGLFLLTQSSVWRAELTPQGSLVQAVRSIPSETAGLPGQSAHYRRDIATHGSAPGCVFFTSAQGVEFASRDFSQRSVLVALPPDRPVLGVTVGRSGPDARTLQTYVYYTLYSDSANGGGVWRVAVPLQCLSPSGTTGGPDAGAADAGGGGDAGGGDAGSDAGAGGDAGGGGDAGDAGPGSDAGAVGDGGLDSGSPDGG